MLKKILGFFWNKSDKNQYYFQVMAFYRATGQAHKPAPPVSTGKSIPSGNQGGK